MSTHIIDSIRAVKISKEASGYYSDLYIIATESGDSNCFVSSGPRSGQRARDWSAFAVGESYRCMSRVCEVSADCCGGMLRLAGSRDTQPETMIRAFRRALNAAVDYNSPDAPFRLSDVAVTFTAEEKVNEPGKYRYDDLIKNRPAPENRGRPYVGPVEAFPFDIYGSAKEAAAFIDAIPYKSPLWHHCRVYPLNVGRGLLAMAA